MYSGLAERLIAPPWKGDCPKGHESSNLSPTANNELFMIEFNCFIKDVLTDMPIVPTSQIDFKWVEAAHEHFKKSQAPSTLKCPGIFSVLSKGWIQRTYQDITISTNGDGESFTSSTPIDQMNYDGGNYAGPYVARHTPDQLAAFKEFPPNTLKTLIKIHSPWFVKIPKGYSLLMMPIPYNDDCRFTALTGILKNNNWLIVQLYWHCLNSVEVIPKGTPINYMMLIKDESNEYESHYVENRKQFMNENYFDPARFNSFPN